MLSIYLLIDLLLRKTNLASSHFIWESETQGGGYQCSMGLPYTDLIYFYCRIAAVSIRKLKSQNFTEHPKIISPK